MQVNPFRWLARNFSTLILAFILSVVVWISAVVTADPNEELSYRPVPIEIVGKDPNLLLKGDIPTQARLTLKAPQSIWVQLNNNQGLVKSWIDLSGLGPGEHTVEVKTQISVSPIRIVRVDPQEITLELETLAQREIPIQLTVTGDLPLGYKKGNPSILPETVTISGSESLVNQVAQARAFLDISGLGESIQKDVPIQVVDENGDSISDLTITPKVAQVTQPISLLGGFKNVAVKVATTGQVANGYRLTNISVSPPTVTLFSDNPQLMNEIPGFVETRPVNLDNLSDDVEISVNLNLPEGVTSVRDPVVLVQVSVAAIEGSLTISVPLEVVGLSSDLEAMISPTSIDVIVAGPLNVLDVLTASNFLVTLDLSGLPAGVYQRAPEIEVDIEQVRVQTTLPETVEVTIQLAPTSSPTATISGTPPTPTASETPSPETATPTPSSTPQP
jgi:YbbR domain-containing protein